MNLLAKYSLSCRPELLLKALEPRFLDSSKQVGPGGPADKSGEASAGDRCGRGRWPPVLWRPRYPPGLTALTQPTNYIQIKFLKKADLRAQGGEGSLSVPVSAPRGQACLSGRNCEDGGRG